MHYDIMFSTDATARTGFGHAARGAQLTRLLRGKYPNVSVAMCGEFEEFASRRLTAEFDLKLLNQKEFYRATVGVYDTMVDSEEPEAWDSDRLEGLRERCDSVVFFANGVVLPDVPSDVIVVGYKLGGPTPHPPMLHWGLNYAPVSQDIVADIGVRREPASVFVALGGAQGSKGIKKVLNALALSQSIGQVSILQSPVNPIVIEDDWLRADQNIQRLNGVRSVGPYLQAAGMVVASYGHLGYEALACGVPVCLVGQKRFQALYADRLESHGLCVSAGLLLETEIKSLHESIERCRRQSQALSTQAKNMIDGKGLDRITYLLGDLVEQANCVAS
jgi:spore coat polysaccharide biosynthesis predicted glycosyltransferase SpsG